MAEECEDEYQEEQGKWEEEEVVEELQETYDVWADRIYKAFKAKRRPPAPAPKKLVEGAEYGPTKSLRPEMDLAQAEENYRILKEARFVILNTVYWSVLHAVLHYPLSGHFNPYCAWPIRH